MYNDYQAVTNLVNSYPGYLDEGDCEGLGRLFQHGSLTVIYDGPGGDAPPYVGPAAVEKFFSDVLNTLHVGKPETRHFVANLVVEVDDNGQTARARSYYVRIDPVSPPQIVITGRYRDSFAKIDGKWWFSERTILSDVPGSALSTK